MTDKSNDEPEEIVEVEEEPSWVDTVGAPWMKIPKEKK